MLPARFAAFFSSPRALAAGFDGREARSAASRALSSAFLAAWAAFLASSASTLEVDLVPFDHFAASSRSSFSCCFAIRASWAAAFYSERQRTGLAKSVGLLWHCRLPSLCFRQISLAWWDDFSWDDEVDRPKRSRDLCTHGSMGISSFPSFLSSSTIPSVS